MNNNSTPGESIKRIKNDMGILGQVALNGEKA